MKHLITAYLITSTIAANDYLFYDVKVFERNNQISHLERIINQPSMYIGKEKLKQIKTNSSRNLQVCKDINKIVYFMLADKNPSKKLYNKASRMFYNCIELTKKIHQDDLQKQKNIYLSNVLKVKK